MMPPVLARRELASRSDCFLGGLGIEEADVGEGGVDDLEGVLLQRCGDFLRCPADDPTEEPAALLDRLLEAAVEGLAIPRDRAHHVAGCDVGHDVGRAERGRQVPP